MAAVHAVCSVRAEGCSLWGAHHIGYSVCMHIINTCAAWWRCESESFSTKWSASRERNKEICSCQGSVSQRLLLEIFWKKKKKSHVWGLSALLSSHFKLRSVESGGKKGRTWVGEFWCWDGHKNTRWLLLFFLFLFFWKVQAFTWFFRGRRRAQVFVLTLKHIRQLKQSCSALSANLLGVCRQSEGVKRNTSHHSLVDSQPL